MPDADYLWNRGSRAERKSEDSAHRYRHLRDKWEDRSTGQINASECRTLYHGILYNYSISMDATVYDSLVVQSAKCLMFRQIQRLNISLYSIFIHRRTIPTDTEARRRLLSASSTSLDVRRTRLSTVGDRASPVAAARLWNSLPSHVTAVPLSPS